jgi:hypothetical protein
MTIEWPEEAGSKIEGKTRLELVDVEDEFQRRDRERREREAQAPPGPSQDA